MSIKYHIYSNDYAGGPVDYSAPVATAAAATYTPAPVPPGSDVTFAVRAFDDATGFEERNVAAAFRLVTGPAGEDLSARPRAPHGLTARPWSAGAVLLEWGVLPRGSSPAATSYRVYGGAPAVDYSAPLLAVPADPLASHYRAAVTGLAGGTAYRFAVRAAAGAVEEANAAEVRGTPPAAGPAAAQADAATVVTGAPRR